MAAETRQDLSIELPQDITEQQFEAYKQAHYIGEFRKSRTPGCIRVSFIGRSSRTSGRTEANAFCAKHLRLFSGLQIAQDHKSVLFPRELVSQLWEEIRKFQPAFQQGHEGDAAVVHYTPRSGQGGMRLSQQTSINGETPGNTPDETPGAGEGRCCIML